ncbi:hypothetical protein [Agrococcus casei]|uniref:Phage protein n=1 Tax=Agrococcus casei LMG 22410 TaxID=1255656 RepID=A0A1R4GFX7_9MICO|nr:hypothetical protein [Agrococcus casei]SJM66842.1 hypothetical protein CZ674_11510 [Agrococcus casei LMG 22410]
MAEDRTLADRLAVYVNAEATDAFIPECAETAEVLIDGYVGSAEVPDKVRERAILEVGSELYNRRNAPNGIAQFATPDAAPIRVARDPLVGAYPILRHYVGIGAA